MSSRALKERKSRIKEILPTVRGMDYPYLRRLLDLVSLGSGSGSGLGLV